VWRVNEASSLRFHRLQRRQTVPAQRARVFPFFESPHNLALITPPALQFRVITPGPVPMRAGIEIDYRIRLAGAPVRWRSLISSYEPPRSFVDEQLEGPYAYWRHTHRFEDLGGRTLILDEVLYALPEVLPSVLEATLHRLYVRPALEHIFDYRARFYADFFGESPDAHGASASGPEPGREREA
jgi:ligand-binding SRPBCC domain-containing protein